MPAAHINTRQPLASAPATYLAWRRSMALVTFTELNFKRVWDIATPAWSANQIQSPLILPPKTSFYLKFRKYEYTRHHPVSQILRALIQPTPLVACVLSHSAEIYPNLDRSLLCVPAPAENVRQPPGVFAAQVQSRHALDQARVYPPVHLPPNTNPAPR